MKFEIKKEVTECVYIHYNYWHYLDNLIALSEKKMIVLNKEDKQLKIIKPNTMLFNHYINNIKESGGEVRKVDFITELDKFINEVQKAKEFYQDEPFITECK